MRFFSTTSSPGLHSLTVTFVGPLGDAHSLANELIVSPPPAPTHATAATTWAAKATTLTCGGRRMLSAPRAMPSPHELCPQHPQASFSPV